MAELKNLLAFMDEEDRARVLDRYNAMFDLAGDDREVELLRCFGSPVRQVLQIEEEYRRSVDNNEKPFLNKEVVLPVGMRERAPLPRPVGESAPAPRGENTGERLTAAELKAAAESLPEPEGVPSVPVLQEPDPDQMDLFLFDADLEAPESDAAPEAAQEVPAITPEEILTPTESAPTALTETEPETAPEEEPVPPSESAPAPALTEQEEPEEEEAEYDEDEEDEYEEDEDEEDDAPEGPGGGRIFAAVLVTVPVIALWVICVALSVAIGGTVAAGGIFCGAGAWYLAGYVIAGTVSFLPDILLVSGGAVALLALGLFLLWTGLWIIITGFRLTIGMSVGIYRGILGRGEEED